MATRPKYRRGPAVRDPVSAISMILAGEWFYWPSDNRPKSPKVLINMAVIVIANAARRGRLHLAIKNEES